MTVPTRICDEFNGKHFHRKYFDGFNRQYISNFRQKTEQQHIHTYACMSTITYICWYLAAQKTAQFTSMNFLMYSVRSDTQYICVDVVIVFECYQCYISIKS